MTDVADGIERAKIIAEEDPAKGGNLERVHLGGWRNVDIGPLAHLAAERHRLDALTWDHFDVLRLSATCGAELHGVDLTTELGDDVVDDIRQALHEYKVIFFRDQPLTSEQHVAFAKRFGELEIHPFIPSNTGQPELVRFEKGADTGGYENGWHHDVTWRAEPSQAAILRAVEVPPTGGDTLFCDMYAAFDGLTDEWRERIDGLVAVHDFMLAFSGQTSDDNRDEMRELYPLVEHPVVIRHHATGRKLIYVNRYFTSHIVGLSPEESGEILSHLVQQASILEYQARFRWEVDSVAFWDNRAVQHYAASDYFPDIRTMERASIKGSRPAA